MATHRRFLFLSSLLAATCVGAYSYFAVIYHRYSMRTAQTRVNAHAATVTEALWSFNPAVSHEYLRRISEFDHYAVIAIHDHVGGPFDTVRTSPSPMERCFMRLGLMPLIPLSATIFRDERPIGEIRAVWRCDTVYLHAYILFSVSMTGLALFQYLRVRRNATLLEERVRQRTHDLGLVNEHLRQEVLERRRAEQALAERESLYRTLFEESPISLWVKDYSGLRERCHELGAMAGGDFRKFFVEHPDHLSRCRRLIRVVDVNRRTLELFEGEGKSVFLEDRRAMAMHDPPPPALLEEVTAVAESRLLDVETTCRTMSGRELRVHMRSSIPPGGAESWSRVFVSMHDLTERVRAEEEKIRFLEQLRQTSKMEAVGTLASGIAHDFNNILSAIIGFTELSLEEAEKGGPLEDNLSQVLRSADRAKALVQQILTFSRQESGEMIPVRIRPVVEEAIQLLRASTPSTIEFRSRLRSNAVVMADSTQIHQVLMNLCANAAQAMREKGGILRILLADVSERSRFVIRNADETSAGHVRIRVSDTGHGIPASIQERIFDPFFTTKERGKGTGLGLSIVHGIVTAHGGFITMRSRPGRTVFDVYLPVANRLEAERLLSPPAAPLRLESRVLWVDDEPVQVALGRQILERIGCEVDGFTDGEEAFRRFRADPHAFDLVVTDMTMPRMNGLTLAVQVRAIRPNIPVIICTGYSEILTSEAARTAGVSAVFPKPLKIRELTRTVAALVSPDDISPDGSPFPRPAEAGEPFSSDSF